MKVQKTVEEGRGNEFVRRCRKEMREKFKKGKVKSDWEESRKRFFEGMEIEEVGRKREEDKKWYGELERVDKEKQKEGENRTVKI